ncbi:ATP-binding protein [Micromonospora aurantiaca]|uniref:AlbA family DNA-binding domain-containing protein n=1 Tax=Micromonospora aurantiaca (nom. illeg.) TaxID=47850 RepID=UPI000F3ADD3E|nr:ATP-binding protein [Micromonospora aurantiaca]RNH93503.1 ATP-binding protein [Micromonospora aurantiaca]
MAAPVHTPHQAPAQPRSTSPAGVLAAGTEETALDFKSTLDLNRRTSKDSLEFIKDCIAMGNLATGGYIVIGVDGRGRPAHDQPPVDVRQFDSADLRSRIAKYVEAPVHILSQAHEVDSRTIVLVYVQPNADGLPVPVSTIGQYSRDGGGSVVVFNEGEVLLREGTSNVRLRYGHWNDLLGRYRDRVRQEARQDIDALVRGLIDTLRGAGTTGGPSVPLLLEMEEDVFADAVVASLEAASTVRIKQFVNNAVATVTAAVAVPDARSEQALDKLGVIATQAIQYDRLDVFNIAIDGLYRAYKPVHVGLAGVASGDIARHWLNTLLRLFAIGSFAVRQQSWRFLPSLVFKPIEVQSNHVYVTWLKHGQVFAARANLLLSADGIERGGQLLSLARDLTARHPALHPDIPASLVDTTGTLSQSDPLLNSLCQFDLWWCIMAQTRAARENASAFYPSCAALHQFRAQPALNMVATNEAVRREVFGTTTDAVIASALVTVVESATVQAMHYGGFWTGINESLAVQKYVHSHLPSEVI